MRSVFDKISTYTTESFFATCAFLRVLFTAWTSSVRKATSSVRYEMESKRGSRSGTLSSGTGTFSSFLMAAESTAGSFSAAWNFGDFRKIRPKIDLNWTWLQNLMTSNEFKSSQLLATTHFWCANFLQFWIHFSKSFWDLYQDDSCYLQCVRVGFDWFEVIKISILSLIRMISPSESIKRITSSGLTQPPWFSSSGNITRKLLQKWS